MKVFLISLSIALALGGSMAAAANVYGWHSTAGIWLAILNLPGTGVWVAVVSRIAPQEDGNSGLCLVCVAVNSAFYFLLIKGVMLLKGKFSS
jgi:hypothetical protein